MWDFTVASLMSRSDGDLFVGAAGDDALEDGEFAGGEGLAAHAFGELFCDGGGDAGFAAVDGLDGGE